MAAVSSLGSSQVTAQLAQVEARLKAPVTNLNNEVAADKANISAWGNISGAISTLSNSLAGISDLATINNRSANSTLTTVATATVTVGAQTGTYNLTNVVLAKTQEIFSALQGSGAAALTGGAGSLTFTLASGKTEQVAVGSGSLTLNGVAAAINKLAGGVQASIISTNTGARLVLQGSATGGSQSFTVAGTGALAAFAYGSATTTDTLTQSASDATLSLNGVPLTNTTNDLTKTISGVTIALVGSGNATITVNAATSGLSSAVSSVASSLNTAISTIAKEIAFVPAASANSSSTAKSGPLLGNFTATDLSDQLLTAVSGAVSSGVSANAIGLSVSSTGVVSFSSAAFAASYAKNPTAVASLVGQIYKTLDSISIGAIGGSGSSTSTASTGIISTGTPSTGSIGAQTISLQGDITSIDSQVTQITNDNNDQLSILIEEYTAAEDASTAASITQSYLNIFTNPSSG